MASKKDKYLESAQRFMLKGQLDKAIKDYQQVVALEPKEIRYRQKLAELLVKDSRKEEAIAQYADIGKHYADNSYFLKAIAVYKQIQRLSPGNTDISLLLASLNHKQGLIGNALAEYGQVVAQMEKNGAFSDAVKVIEQMLEIDGDQVSIRLKHAELLFASGAENASYQAFSSLLNTLNSRGDAAGAKQVSDRMAKLFPEHQGQNLDTFAKQIAAGKADQAIPALQKWLKRDPSNVEAWQLLTDAQRRKGDLSAVRASYSQMMEQFPDDNGVFKGAIRSTVEAGDSAAAFALLQRHLPRFVDKGEIRSSEELLPLFASDEAEQLKVAEWLKKFFKATGVVATSGAAGKDAPSAFDTPSLNLELPNAFALPPEDMAPELPDLSDQNAWPSEPSGSPKTDEAEGQELPLPWEEEIDLDLGDDLQGGLDLSLDADESQDVAPFAEPAESAPEEPSEEPSIGDLSFLSEPAPAAPQTEAASEPEAARLELALPDDAEAFPDFDWSEEPEPEAKLDEADQVMDMASLQDLHGTGEPEAFGEADPALELEPSLDAAVSLDAAAGWDEVDSAEVPEEAAAEVAAESAAEVTEESAAEAAAEVSEESAAEVAAEEARPLRGWEEIYPEALAGDRPIDANDLFELESHYDLGLGYREMGMYDGAIKELNVAALNPQRRLACLTLQAKCYLEKGDVDKARDLLQRGLELDVLSDEERVTLSYELALLHETTGAVDDAITMYRKVHAANPGFGDVANKLFELTGEEPLDIIELEPEDGDF